MFRIYCLQQWFNLSHSAAEELLYDTQAVDVATPGVSAPANREFTQKGVNKSKKLVLFEEKGMF